MPKLTLDGIVKVLGLRGHLLRRAAFALAVLLGAGVALSVPAHAQSNNDDFTPLNSRIKRERQFPTEPPNRHGPEQMSKVNRDRSKAMLGQFGKCLYNRSHEKSLDLLEKTDFGFVSFEQVNMDTDKAMKILGFMDCLGRVADTHQSGVRLNFSAGGVRQWLLQEAYFARYPDGPTWLTPGNVIAERHYPLSDSNRGVRSAMDLADCVVAADPYGADYLYRVPADSEGEKAALNSLLPALGPCVPEGLQLQIEPYTFRVWMGEALWQASNHNVPAEAAGSGGAQ